MTALTLFQRLRAWVWRLTPYPDGTLGYKAPKGVLTPQLLDAMRVHKQMLLDLVETSRSVPPFWNTALDSPGMTRNGWPGRNLAVKVPARAGVVRYTHGTHQPPQARAESEFRNAESVTKFPCATSFARDNLSWKAPWEAQAPCEQRGQAKGP